MALGDSLVIKAFKVEILPVLPNNSYEPIWLQLKPYINGTDPKMIQRSLWDWQWALRVQCGYGFANWSCDSDQKKKTEF